MEKLGVFLRGTNITCRPNVNPCDTQILTVCCYLIRLDTGNSAVNELYAQLYTYCTVRATFFFEFTWGGWSWVPGVFGFVFRFIFWFYACFPVFSISTVNGSWILFYGLFSALFSAFTALVSWFQLVLILILIFGSVRLKVAWFWFCLVFRTTRWSLGSGFVWFSVRLGPSFLYDPVVAWFWFCLARPGGR